MSIILISDWDTLVKLIAAFVASMIVGVLSEREKNKQKPRQPQQIKFVEVLNRTVQRDPIYSETLRKRLLKEDTYTRWKMFKYRFTQFINWMLHKHD